jgi:hypothetical protein
MNKKKLLKLSGFAATVAVIFCAGFLIYAVYRELDPRTKAESSLFQPKKELPDPNPLFSVGKIQGKEIDFVSNGTKLNGWFYRNPNSDKVILYSHGNGGNSAHPVSIHAIEDLLTCGQSVFAYDYAGYGRSEGTANTKSAIASAVAAYDCLHQTMHYRASQISAVGISLGAATTAQLMARRQLAKVALVSGFASPRAVALDISPLFGIYAPESFDGVGLVTIATLQSPHPPLLIMHGIGDSLIHEHQARENFAAASEPKSLLILPNSTHDCPSPTDHQLYIKTLNTFLNHD